MTDEKPRTAVEQMYMICSYFDMYVLNHYHPRNDQFELTMSGGSTGKKYEAKARTLEEAAAVIVREIKHDTEHIFS